MECIGFVTLLRILQKISLPTSSTSSTGQSVHLIVKLSASAPGSSCCQVQVNSGGCSGYSYEFSLIDRPAFAEFSKGPP
eukprot:5408578-Amphidinium_carterae.2